MHEKEGQGVEGGVIKAVLISSSLSLPGESITGVRAKWSAESMPQMVVAEEKSHVEVFDNVCAACIVDSQQSLTSRSKMPFVFPDDFEKVFMTDMSLEDQKN